MDKATLDYLSSDNEELYKRPARIAGYIKVSIDEAEKRLAGLAKVMGYSCEEIHDWPAHLEEPDRRFHSYANRRRIQDRGTRFMRLHKDKVDLLIGLRDDQYFYGDIYVDGRLRGGNHDFSLFEVAMQMDHP